YGHYVRFGWMSGPDGFGFPVSFFAVPGRAVLYFSDDSTAYSIETPSSLVGIRIVCEPPPGERSAATLPVTAPLPLPAQPPAAARALLEVHGERRRRADLIDRISRGVLGARELDEHGVVRPVVVLGLQADPQLVLLGRIGEESHLEVVRGIRKRLREFRRAGV